MSTLRSLITGMFLSGAMRRRPSLATRPTWVRHVHRATPLTVMAHEPHMPTRQEKRYASVASMRRWT